MKEVSVTVRRDGLRWMNYRARDWCFWPVLVWQVASKDQGLVWLLSLQFLNRGAGVCHVRRFSSFEPKEVGNEAEMG